jgi:hypothetical protein
MKKQTFLLLGIVGLGIGAVFAWTTLSKAGPAKPTYFEYPSTVMERLERKEAYTDINVADIYLWNQRAFRLVSEGKLTDVEASRVYAYLAVAQHDFASLSYNAKGKYAGSINLVSQQVLCRFFADKCDELTLQEKYSEFTQTVTDEVIGQIDGRIQRDKVAAKPYEGLKTDKNLWMGQQPSVGIDAMNRLPWHITEASQFRPPAKSSLTTKSQAEQLDEVRNALAAITDEQRARVVFWAGGPGTKTPPGMWLNIADQYMKQQETELETVVGVHADLMTAIADSVIAVFDSKYYYQQKRPFAYDATLKTVMPTPNHPSYPAGHAAISGAAYSVLMHHFPTAEGQWLQNVSDASDTRVLGGIHFSVDNVAGLTLGKRVGTAAIEATNK